MSKVRYLTVRQIIEEKQYPFSYGHLRDLLWKRYENGLSTAIRKVGGRLCIREDLFDAWIETHKDKQK